MTMDEPFRARSWRSLVSRLTLSDLISIVAVCIALGPLVDLVVRKLTAPEIEILPPPQVEFRTEDVVRMRDNAGRVLSHDGSSANPVIDRSTAGKMSTYVVLPLSYINRGDVGEDFLVPHERLRMKLGNKSYMYIAAYTTAIVPRAQQSWIGDPSPRLPAILEGGRARSDEVVFVPNGYAFTWADFLDALKNHQNNTIKLTLEVETVSRRTFASMPCQLSIDHLLKQLDSVKSDRSRYYFVGAKCER